MPSPDGLRDRQSDAGVIEFGAKEGFGRLPEDLRTHSAAGITDLDDGPTPRVDARRDGQCTGSPLHRLNGILKKVTEHRPKPGGVTGNRWNWTEVEDSIDVGAGCDRRRFDPFLNQSIEVYESGRGAGGVAINDAQMPSPIDQLTSNLRSVERRFDD